MKKIILLISSVLAINTCFASENETFNHNAKNGIVSKYPIAVILNQLQHLEDTAKDIQKVQELYSVKLTNELEKQIAPQFANYEPDSLLVLLQRAQKFKYYSKVDAQHQMLFEVINTYWMNFVANKLNDYYTKKDNLKYSNHFG
jgi:hypothetical protein